MFGNMSTQPALRAVYCGGARGPFRDGGPRLSDADIRAALLSRGFGVLADHATLLEEVECWRGYVRADYVCLSPSALAVVEIKSDRDTLRRFDEQVRVYSAVADRVTVVVGWSLAAQVLRAAPFWWDIVLAEREAISDVRFVPLRDGAQNPAVTAAALVAMLPVAEVRRLARASHVSCGRLRSRDLRQVIANQLSCEELRVVVREWMAGRPQQNTRILS
jgi:hypothetical protein